MPTRKQGPLHLREIMMEGLYFTRHYIWQCLICLIAMNGVHKGPLNYILSLITAPFLWWCFILSFQWEHPLSGSFFTSSELNDSCLHDTVLYRKESLGSYLETNSRKDNVEEQIKGKPSEGANAWWFQLGPYYWLMNHCQNIRASVRVHSLVYSEKMTLPPGGYYLGVVWNTSSNYNGTRPHWEFWVYSKWSTIAD